MKTRNFERIQNAVALSLLTAGLFALALLSGCINQGGDTSLSVGGTAASKSTTAASGKVFSIVSSTFEAVNASPSPSPIPNEIDLFFNASNPSQTLNSVCVGSGDNTKACNCQFTFSQQTTGTNNSATQISRTVTSTVDQVTSFQVRCPLPAPWQSGEILDGTQVKISVAPASTSTQSFSTNSIIVTKTAATQQGDFRDVQGRSFFNIFHYVCYDRLTKNVGIAHNTVSVSGPSGLSTFTSVANDFVLGSTTFTGQSYYYDFFIRSTELGSPNSSSSGFVCPTTTVGGVTNFYPMDTSFALAVNSSTDFPLQVNALTVAPISAQQNIVGLVGFAAKPLADGTCPSFADQSGQIRRTFRLRKYQAAYPLRFNADGDIKDTSQQVNTIYILDRPVNKASINSLKPITRIGPKPCPFSFATAQFGQRCMSDASLTGWNIDGDQITGDPKCPVFPPVPNSVQKTDGTVVVRPYKAFLPRYLEDTSFQACAFQSSDPVDPPIVLSTDSTIFPGPAGPYDFWCSVNYPPADPNPLNRAPALCSLADSAAAVKTDKTYACSLSYNPTNASRLTPQAGCCQVCAGTNCTSVGAGITPGGRNAAFSPPKDNPPGNPAQGIKQLSGGKPNVSSSSCFDPSED